MSPTSRAVRLALAVPPGLMLAWSVVAVARVLTPLLGDTPGWSISSVAQGWRVVLSAAGVGALAAVGLAHAHPRWQRRGTALLAGLFLWVWVVRYHACEDRAELCLEHLQLAERSVICVWPHGPALWSSAPANRWTSWGEFTYAALREAGDLPADCAPPPQPVYRSRRNQSQLCGRGCPLVEVNGRAREGRPIIDAHQGPAWGLEAKLFVNSERLRYAREQLPQAARAWFPGFRAQVRGTELTAAIGSLERLERLVEELERAGLPLPALLLDRGPDPGPATPPRTPGLRVAGAAPGADLGPLRPGDVLEQLDGRPLRDELDLLRACAAHGPGTAQVVVRRGSHRLQLPLRLEVTRPWKMTYRRRYDFGEREERPGSGLYPSQGRED